MRNFKIIFALTFFLSNKGFCQEESIDKNNIVFVELGGAVIFGVGLGYERYLHINPAKRFSLRAGLGLVDDFSSHTSLFGGSFIYGKKSSLELGLNYLINYDANTFRTIGSNESKFQNDVQILVGYRYQNWRNGTMFRIFYVPPVGCCNTYIPIYGGLSLGYAF